MTIKLVLYYFIELKSFLNYYMLGFNYFLKMRFMQQFQFTHNQSSKTIPISLKLSNADWIFSMILLVGLIKD